MKRILILLLAAGALFASCGTTRLTPQEKQALAALVARAVNDRDMTIDITGVFRGGNNISYINKEYSIWMDGNHITTRLPFVGVSRYGGINDLMGDVSIVLDNAEIYNFSVDRSKLERKGEYILAFQARQDIHTIYTFNINLFDNGEADIYVTATNRTSMRYCGSLSLERHD